MYSIIKDYKDLAVEHHKKSQKPSDPSGKSQARDEEIAMGDISNIMPPQPIKRSTSICFTAESSKEEERPTKTNQTEIFPRQKASGFGHSSPSTTMQMPPLSPQPACKMRYGLKSSDNQASRDYGLPQQQVQKTLTPQETRPRERQPFVDVTPPIPTKLMLEQNLLEDDPVVIPPSPTHSNHYGITVLRSDTLHTNNLDKTQNGNMARSKSGRNDRNKLPTSQNKRTFGMADDEEYRIHDLQLDLVKTSNFGGPYLSAGVHASNKSYELKTLTGYEQVPVLRDPKDDHKRGSRTPKSTSKSRQAPPSQPLKKVPSKAFVNQQEAQKENLDTRNRTSTNSYVFLRSKDGRMMDKSNLDTKKCESINFTQNSSSYSYHHQLGTGQQKNTHNSLEYEQDTYYLGPASHQPQNEFQFRLGPSTGSVSNLSMHKPQMQAIHQIELESPTEEGFADYVPKALRKKKQHPHILAKVDHRRDRSHSRLNGSVSSQSILDKQFKVAKVDTFENVMNNLRGGGHGSRSLYEDHFKKGFLN